MMRKFLLPWRMTAALLCFFALAVFGAQSQAQNASSGSNQGTIQGRIVDQSGKAIPGAAIAVISATQIKHTAVTDAAGKYAVTGLPAGSYSVQASATGFAPAEQDDIAVAAGKPVVVSMKLPIASVAQEVSVEAEADTSLAARQSPVKSLLDAASARTEITSTYINEYTSPVTDFSDITQAAPGTVSWSSNGIGMGEAKTYFRGFVDDDYTMTWDGVPFEDSNDPSHHSWAYVPAAAIGYVDFDRSPGTAADMGPANYGGSIHFFSPKLGWNPWMRADVAYGSFNTKQILGEFNSGLFGGKNPKATFWFEGHHMSSDGYQTGNFQVRTAASAKFNYKFSDTMNLTLIGTAILVDSNTPKNDPTRAQIAAYGDNYLLELNQYNADGSPNAMWYKFYNYHIPTDFEIITFTKDFAHGWRLELKPYTYSYSNHQHYQILQETETDPLTATSALDKLNEYSRGGAIASVSAASHYGVFRTGLWYEFTPSYRYQIDSNPLTWVDSTTISKIKFREHFDTTIVQPYAEYQLVAIPHWTITAGIKDAYYNMYVKQWASGKDVGPLTCTTSETSVACPAYTTHDAGYNSWLPSFEANYRIRDNWSAYAQYGRGSIIPFSDVFDVTGATVQAAPPPTIASTYQGGTVLKLNRLSMDADAYHIHFVNQYASAPDTDPASPDFGFTYYYATPPSDTNGFEAEGNFAVTHALGLFANGTLGEAKYEAASASTVTTGGSTQNNPATPSAWVADTPKDTMTIGTTYKDKHLDLGFFNKRIGTRYDDDGSYHQNITYDPFWMSNLFLNYALHNGSRFGDSKIKLSINNLFDNHNTVAISAANPVTADLVPYTQNSLDQLELLPGRSIMISFTMNFSPKKR